MAQSHTVDHRGKKVHGESLSFKAVHEAWNEYELENGGLLRMKLVPEEIIVTDEQTEGGETLIFVRVATLLDYKKTKEETGYGGV